MYRVVMKTLIDEKPVQAIFHTNGLALRQWCKGMLLKSGTEHTEFEVFEEREIVVAIIRAEDLEAVKVVEATT